GPLDETASAMLAQLLDRHGLRAKVAAYHEASRSGIATLDLDDIAMICISYLDINGNPSHLRYLMRRLRARTRGVPILVGLWPADENAAENKNIRSTVGADFYATTLREALQACLSEAAAPRDASAA